MTVVADVGTVTIRLEGDCAGSVECGPLADRVHEQLSGGGYSHACSTLPLPADMAAYLAEHRTARKRAAQAARLGYTFAPFSRENHADGIHAINVSMPERQGRPMSAGYRERPSFSPLPDYPCDRHRITAYGVRAADGTLAAYCVIYRVGDLVMFSQILGHGDHLDAGIMYLLVSEVVREQAAAGPGTAFYNRHDSGRGGGLRWMKERLGFTATRVDWRL